MQIFLAKRISFALLFALLLAYPSARSNAQQVSSDESSNLNVSIVYDLWPGNALGKSKVLAKETDTTKPDDDLVAEKRLIRLTNVSVPQVAIYKPAPDKSNQTAIIIAPGGGHWILAYDLEGTEIAQWLTSIGVTAIVLKYRVPGNAWNENKRWLAAAQDGQRAVSLVRGKADELGIDPERIGIIGFSAGGTPVMHSAFGAKRLYEPVDQYDTNSYRPNFAAPIYASGIPDKAELSKNSPKVFMVATSDDPWVNPKGIVETYVTLQKEGVSTELHMYESGGHGFGLRQTKHPVTNWPKRMQAWLRQTGFL